MPFALQLFVDPVSDTAIRSLWEELASTDLSSMRDSGNRPHSRLPKRTLPLLSPSTVWDFPRRAIRRVPGSHRQPRPSGSAQGGPSVAARCWRIPRALLPPWALDSSLCTCDSGASSSRLSRGRDWSRHVLSPPYPHRGDWGDRVSPCETPLRFSLDWRISKVSRHDRLCHSRQRQRAGSSAETAVQELVF